MDGERFDRNWCRRRGSPTRGRQGPQVRRSREPLESGHRGRLHGTGVQPRRDSRLRRGGRRDRGTRPGDHDRLVHPDAVDRGGLLLAQPGGPRLRHQLHLGDPSDGSSPRLVDRMGHRGRGRRRDGGARLHRRQVHLPAVRPGRGRRQPPRRQHCCGRVDHRDDLDLLRRDRALGTDPVRAADGGDRDPRSLLGLRPRSRLHRQSGHPDRALLVLPLRHSRRHQRPRRRRAARRLHLLGLGQRRLRERGI